MGRSRYKIYEPTHPHFVTCTILQWLPIFTNKKSVDIVINSLKFLQQRDNLKLILENHIHMILKSNDLPKTIHSFKRHTVREIIKLLQQESAKTLLEQFKFYKKAHKRDKDYQIWQEGYKPKLIQTDKMMIKLINYIHQNPVKRGFVYKAEHWRYSSARDYMGGSGLIEIEKFF